MTDSPALCPRCGSMLAVYEADAGAYVGCDECLWMSVPLHLDESASTSKTSSVTTSETPRAVTRTRGVSSHAS